MVTFIEADAEQYAKLAKVAKHNVMVHRNEDDTLTCEIKGKTFNADNAWQMASRIESQGFFGYSMWLDSVFSEPGVMWPEGDGEAKPVSAEIENGGGDAT